MGEHMKQKMTMRINNTRPRLTHDDLKRLISYDPEEGVPKWRPRSFPQDFSHPMQAAKWNKRNVGWPAGAPRDDYKGTYRVTIMGQQYSGNKIIWYYMTGQWPRGIIYNIDGDTANCRWENLASTDPDDVSFM